MPRLAVAACAASLTLVLSACGGGGPAATQSPAPMVTTVPATTAPPATATPAEPSPGPTPTPSPTATPAAATPTPTPAAPGGATDPTKLDQATLRPDQLPGWRPAEPADQSDSSTSVEPAECAALQTGTLGKVASDMGATVGFDKDDQHLAEFLDVVDTGAGSVTALESALAKCGSFTMTDADEKTPVTVTRFDVPALGEKALGLKLTMLGDAPVDTYVVVAGFRDVLLTTTVQGEHPDRAALVDATTKAMDRLKASI